jgi:glycosyltransferase involved in cell wall biosynthesis
MKILLVVRWPVGGIRTYLRYIYSQVVFEQYELVLLAPDIEISAFLAAYFPAGRIEFIPTGNNDADLKQSFVSLINSRKFDLIHSHGFSAAALINSVPKIFPVPHVMTAHDVFRVQQFKGIKGKLKLLGLNLLFKRLSGVLTVGNDAYINFKKFVPTVSNRTIHNIDHGVDGERFSTALPRNYERELALNGKKTIGFFGRFMSQKGFFDLIKAIEILATKIDKNEMPLVLTFGWGGFIREDYELIERLGLSDYFKQMPFTDDMPASIKGVDLVVMPSRWEACGLLAMEVLCAGVPLIASNCIGLRCVVENTPAQVINPYNSIELANAIQAELLMLPNKFKEFQAVAVERFSIERSALELHNYYQVLKGGVR